MHAGPPDACSIPPCGRTSVTWGPPTSTASTPWFTSRRSATIRSATSTRRGPPKSTISRRCGSRRSRARRASSGSSSPPPASCTGCPRRRSWTSGAARPEDRVRTLEGACRAGDLGAGGRLVLAHVPPKRDGVRALAAHALRHRLQRSHRVCGGDGKGRGPWRREPVAAGGPRGGSGPRLHGRARGSPREGA